MTLISGFHPSINGDRKVGAEFFDMFFGTLISNGVFPNPSTGLQVVEGTGLQTIVRAGRGWINGRFISNESDYVLQHDLADGVLKRIDRIVMRLDYVERLIKIEIKKGTLATNPVAPTLQRDVVVWELALADVLIGNGITQISQANITDQRLNNNLCGIVHGLVEQVDTTTLFNQYQSWYNTTTNQAEIDFDTFMQAWEQTMSQWKLDMDQWKTQEQEDFEDWLFSLEELLDENIAATLTNKVSILETTVANQLSEDVLNQYASNVDTAGIYRVVDYKRANNTLHTKTTLSNPNASGNYQTCTIQKYNAEGTTVIETIVWALTYDSDGVITSKVVA